MLAPRKDCTGSTTTIAVGVCVDDERTHAARGTTQRVVAILICGIIFEPCRALPRRNEVAAPLARKRVASACDIKKSGGAASGVQRR
jgi:hypothetical protein